MIFFVIVPFVAALFSLLLAFARLLRRPRTTAASCFFAGMTALALESVFTGLSLFSAGVGELLNWLTIGFIVKSFTPAAWLGFSLAYSRGDSRALLARWKVPLLLAGILPLGLSLGFRESLFQLVPLDAAGGAWVLQFSTIGEVVNGILLVALVLVLMNLEQTFRAAVGTMRWRIKFVVVALGVVLGTHIYVRSQTLLFSAYDLSLLGVESGALLVGCVLLAIAYIRTGLAETDIFPSVAVLRSSLTILLVGGYLLVVGVLAQLAGRLGAESFQLQAFIVLLGTAGLAVLLLSDRARQRMHVFAARHFRKAQHDSVQIWTTFSQRLAAVRDEAGLCRASARLLSETFDVLSATIWLVDRESRRLVRTASTAEATGGGAPAETALPGATFDGLQGKSAPFDLDRLHEAWAEDFRRVNPTVFASGGNRICIPLHADQEVLGAIVLADRVGAATYSVEELELLKCIGDQMTSALLNLRLAAEVGHARELEAFRTMSAFFVHDLKNTASSLNLMLKNLPVHFDDPAFRQDALRSIGNTARHIDTLVARLRSLRERPDVARVQADLNELVRQSVTGINGVPNVELVQEYGPVPPILADAEQITSVVTNLLLNAREALGAGGRIEVRTEQRGERVVLSVADNGCGMSESFLRTSLFRPFSSTKKKGLGIGLFQSRAIVQAHGGVMQVESEIGRGTTFEVSFPVQGLR